MGDLTPHFSLDEFTASDRAEQEGIANNPTMVHRGNIRVTAQGMEAVRGVFGRAVVISSGYRNPELNALVGGVPDSAHALGWACDFHVAGFSDLQVARVLADQIKTGALRCDQLIYEKGRCVHISFDPRARRQILSQPGGPGSPVSQGINP